MENIPVLKVIEKRIHLGFLDQDDKFIDLGVKIDLPFFLVVTETIKIENIHIC